MSKARGSGNRHPPRWMTQAYRMLAAGRYALEWLPELIKLYELTVDENGDEEGDRWLLEELALTISPRLIFLVIKLAKFVYKIWRST